jgi:hypothetical protein
MTKISIWQISSSGITTTYHGHPYLAFLEVSFGVWPVAPGHRAGVFWTTDGWSTTRLTPASWDRNVPNYYGGYDEIWKVTMQTGAPPLRIRIWYALYVEDAQGTRYWDNNQGWNYERILSWS